MSAYIVSNKTISAIVKGFEMYNANFRANDYKEPKQILIDGQAVNNAVGQSLLNQNYRSVNERYGEDTQPPIYKFENVKIDEGVLIGCINCYNYQASETNDYYESDLYFSLQRLKDAILESLINQKGLEMPWGYEE